MSLCHDALRWVFLPWNVVLKVDRDIVTNHLTRHRRQPQWISMLPSYHKLQDSTRLFTSRIFSVPDSKPSLDPSLAPQPKPSRAEQTRHPSPTPSTLHKPFRKPGHPQIPQKKTAYPHTDPALGHLYLSTLHISIHVLISDSPTPQNPLTKISSDPLASLTSLVVPSHPLPDRASTLVSTTSI